MKFVFHFQATVVSGSYQFPINTQSDTTDIVMSDVCEENNVKQRENDGDDIKDDTTPKKLPLHVKILWVLFTIVYDVNVVVVTLYWSVLNNGRPVTFYRINPHGVIFILLLVDFTFHLIPVRILHVVYTCGFAAAFLVFSVVHDLVTGVPVYPILDYKQKAAMAAVFAALSCLLLVFSHFVLYYLNCLKAKVRNR